MKNKTGIGSEIFLYHSDCPREAARGISLFSFCISTVAEIKAPNPNVVQSKCLCDYIQSLDCIQS